MTSGIQYGVLFTLTAENISKRCAQPIQKIFRCLSVQGQLLRRENMFQTKQNDYETLRKDLEQLRREVRIERMKVSKSVEE